MIAVQILSLFVVIALSKILKKEYVYDSREDLTPPFMNRVIFRMVSAIVGINPTPD